MTTLLPFALSLLLQSTALLLLGLLALRLTHSRGPAVQTLIGRATLAGVALLLLLTPLTGQIRIRPVWRVALPSASTLAEPTPPRSSAPLPTPIKPKGEGKERPPRPNSGEPETSPGLRTSPSPSFRAEPEGAASSTPAPSVLTPRPPLWRGPLRSKEVGSILYAAVTLTLLLWLAVCQGHLTRLRRTATPLPSGPAADLLAELTPHPPQILTHQSVRSPFLAGLVRPAIFLPPTYATDFDAAALRAILVHELAHLQRRDNLWTLASRLLCALCWPQPLLWLLCRRMEQLAEDACDAAVLARHCPPRAYAACLLTLAERHPLPRRQRALGAGVAPYRSALGRRVQRILTQGKQTMLPISTKLRLTIAALTLAAVLGGLCTVSSAPAKPNEATPPVLTPQEQQYRTAKKQDLQNLQKIGRAMFQYEQEHYGRDNNARTPDAQHWMDQIAPYLHDQSVFFDPFQPGKKRYGYAFNRNCSHKSVAAFKAPSETVMVFDSKLGTRNANDTGASLRILLLPSGGSSGSAYGFADTHAKWFPQGMHPSFSLKGGEPIVSSASELAQKPSLIGTWLCSQADGTGNVLIFSANGNIEEIGPWPGESREVGHAYSSYSAVGHSYGHYTVAGSKLNYTLNSVWVEGGKPWSGGSEKHAMDYTLSGDTLTLRWNGSHVSVSRRVPAYTKAMLGLKPNTSPEAQLYTKTNQQLSKAQFLAGLTAVQGPGVVVTLRDSKQPFPKAMPAGYPPPNNIHDTDINQVVNELRAAGAEAISVNDQRLVATSPVRTAGTVIFINTVAQTSPYTIKAIGNSTEMLSGLNAAGGIAGQIRSFDKAMFDVQELKMLTLPAYSEGSEPHYARPVSEAATANQTAKANQINVRDLRQITSQINRVKKQLDHQQLHRQQKDLRLRLIADVANAEQEQAHLMTINAQLSALKFTLRATPSAETDQIKLLDQEIGIVLAKITRLTVTENKVPNHPEVIAAKAQLQALETARTAARVKAKQDNAEAVRVYMQRELNVLEEIAGSKSRMAEANRQIRKEQAALEASTKRMQNVN